MKKIILLIILFVNLTIFSQNFNNSYPISVIDSSKYDSIQKSGFILTGLFYDHPAGLRFLYPIDFHLYTDSMLKDTVIIIAEVDFTFFVDSIYKYKIDTIIFSRGNNHFYDLDYQTLNNFKELFLERFEITNFFALKPENFKYGLNFILIFCPN
jgi:hypothetical protein